MTWHWISAYTRQASEAYVPVWPGHQHDIEHTEFMFFFQAEDGIQVGRVTGVQTCALPIYERANDGAAGRVDLRSGARRGEPRRPLRRRRARAGGGRPLWRDGVHGRAAHERDRDPDGAREIGRASCRERV